MTAKKALRLYITCPFLEESTVTGGFPSQMASNAENVSISWRHRVTTHSPVGEGVLSSLEAARDADEVPSGHRDGVTEHGDDEAPFVV